MKYVLWGIVGIVILVGVVIGVGVYWASNVKVDFSDPQVAARFKENFNTSCVSTYQKRATKNGANLSDAQLANVDSACGCARDAVADLLAKRPPMTVVEIAGLMKNDAQINGATHACAAKFGIQDPA